MTFDLDAKTMLELLAAAGAAAGIVWRFSTMASALKNALERLAGIESKNLEGKLQAADLQLKQLESARAELVHKNLVLEGKLSAAELLLKQIEGAHAELKGKHAELAGEVRPACNTLKEQIATRKEETSVIVTKLEGMKAQLDRIEGAAEAARRT